MYIEIVAESTDTFTAEDAENITLLLGEFRRCFAAEDREILV